MSYTPNADPHVRYAEQQVLAADSVSVSVSDRRAQIRKFGRNAAVGTSTHTIWLTGADDNHETYLANNVNTIDTISSSNAGDTTKIRVAGLTDLAGQKTYVEQNTTLNGQTKVVLGIPLNRVVRAYNQGSADLVGTAYVYADTAISSGKPSDTTKIHLTVSASSNQSEKASTTLAQDEYFFITEVYADYQEKSGTNTCNIDLQTRENGLVFRTRYSFAITTGTGKSRMFLPYLPVRPDSDIRLVATSSTGSQEITGGFNGYLAQVM